MFWSFLTVPKPSLNPTDGFLSSVGRIPGSVTVTFTVRISTGAGLTTGSIITNDGLHADSGQGVGTTGSPQFVTIAAPFAIVLSPASQTDGTRAGQVITYSVSVHNLGFTPDVYALTTSGNAWPTTFWNASFTTPITRTASVAPGDTYTFGVKVSVPASATSGQTDTVTVRATSKGNPLVSGSATIQTIAVTNSVLLVDENGNDPPITAIYNAALNANSLGHDVWNLGDHPNLGLNYMKAHNVIVWYTGVTFPGPLGPYEGKLAAFLDNGGRLFLSGMDILDQSAGTSAFVHDYLHVSWDGSEAQNDVGTASVTGVAISPVTSGIGTIGLDFGAIGYADFADGITPVSPAIPAFTLNPTLTGKLPAGTPDALSVDTGTYKVVFLAFPFEAYGNAGDRADLINRALIYLGPHNLGPHKTFLPLIVR